jgi:hypothetical protein
MSRDRTPNPDIPDPEQPRISVQVRLEDEPWDLSDPLNPQPLVYPVCPECRAPWQYSWAWVVDGAPGHTDRWVWTRPPGIPKGCKHRGRPQVYHVRTGELADMPDHVKDRPEDHGG